MKREEDGELKETPKLLKVFADFHSSVFKFLKDDFGVNPKPAHQLFS